MLYGATLKLNTFGRMTGRWLTNTYCLSLFATPPSVPHRDIKPNILHEDSPKSILDSLISASLAESFGSNVTSLDDKLLDFGTEYMVIGLFEKCTTF